MTALEEFEDIVGKLENIEPYGIEPDFSSLGLEPAEVLGFQTEEELENAIKHLTLEDKSVVLSNDILEFSQSSKIKLIKTATFT